MNQQPLRIFVSYASGETQYASMIEHFLEHLRAQQVEVIADDGQSHLETEMLGELQRCNRFVLIQTPNALVSVYVRTITYAALVLARKGLLQGIRYVLVPISPDELPEEWGEGLASIDATQDNPHTQEQLVQLLLGKTPAQESTAPYTSEPASSFSPEHDKHQGTQTSSSVEHCPPPLTNRLPRKISRAGLLALTIAALLVLFLLSLSLGRSFLLPAPSQPSLIGYIHFTSNIQEINDGIQGDLAPLPPAAPGKSYYAWLLPDATNGLGTTVLIGKLSVSETGTVHIAFEDPDHTDLLAAESQFLITEEAANTTPILPTPDKTAWRYYAKIPQTPKAPHSEDIMGDMSFLTHLRHLLVDEPHLEMNSFHGGLVTWLQQYVRKTLEWSNAARGIVTPSNPELMHRRLISILDYLDGDQYVEASGDVAPGTPLIVDAPIGLLTFEPVHQDPPGYVMHVDLHLQYLATSPGATSAQQDLAIKVGQALNAVKGNLDNARQDAVHLAQMNDTQLLDPKTIPLLDDLITQTENAYVGNYNSTNGMREGGVIWVHDQIEHLASFSVMKYSTMKK